MLKKILNPGSGIKLHKMKKIKNKLELVSIHIPKTAGTSFRNILKEYYGEENAVRFDISNTSKRIGIENEEFTKGRLPKNIKAIHGHFYYSSLIELVDLSEDVKIITWMRDPVERVISNYYYLSKRLREELDEEGKGLNILAKMQKSLLEYASAEISRNRMYKFLKGADLEKFFYIGIHKHYNEDVIELTELLGIDKPEIFEHNITGDKEEVSQELIKEISDLNSFDVELYNKALELRKSRKS